MKTLFSLAVALCLSPIAALAMPVVGDVVGTSPDTATEALSAAGCTVNSFEPEDGKIEAKCTETASGKDWEIYIDPKTGAVTDVKSND